MTVVDVVAADRDDTAVDVADAEAWRSERLRFVFERGRVSNKRKPTEADTAVGAQILAQRIAIGMPRGELSRLIGVSVPQLYRYERGLTRVAASRLVAIARALDVSAEVLTSAVGEGLPEDHVARPELQSLVRAFSRIDCDALRSALVQLAQSMAKADPSMDR